MASLEEQFKRLEAEILATDHPDDTIIGDWEDQIHTWSHRILNKLTMMVGPGSKVEPKKNIDDICKLADKVKYLDNLVLAKKKFMNYADEEVEMPDPDE